MEVEYEAFGNFWEITFGVSVTFGEDCEGGHQWPPAFQKLGKSCQKLRSNIRPGLQKLPTSCSQLSKSCPKVAPSSKVTFGQVCKSFQKSTRWARASKGLHAGRGLAFGTFGAYLEHIFLGGELLCYSREPILDFWDLRGIFRPDFQLL